MRKTRSTFAGWKCGECGIDLGDGYSLDCERCNNRRLQRLNRGETFTPTGYPGEAIDNRDRRGRLTFAH